MSFYLIKHVTAVWILIVYLGLLSPVMAQQRIALVIGNSQYQHVATLQNPVNDARDMAATLRDLNFEVTLLRDASKLKMEQTVAAFIQSLGDGDTGLFYYAGHGVQIEGDNYLVPIETLHGSEAAIKSQSFNISQLLSNMGHSHAQRNIIILDACRDNPFSGESSLYPEEKARALKKKGHSEIKSGLSKLNAPPNTLIAFATAPGQVALDGVDGNSPYSQQLMRFMKKSGLPIEHMFRQVRAEVMILTDGEQIPWESSSLIGSFYFKPRTSLPMGF